MTSAGWGPSLRQRAQAAAGAEGRNRDAGLAAELEQRQNLIGPAGIKNHIGQMDDIPVRRRSRSAVPVAAWRARFGTDYLF